MGELSGFGDHDMRLGRVHRDEGAQGLVEFALVAIVLLMLFLGTVDYGRFLYYGTAVRNAARIGAEVASNASCPSSGLCGHLDSSVINDYVMQATVCEPQTVSLSPSLPCTTCIDTPCAGTTTPCSSTPCVPCNADVCIVRFNKCTGACTDPCDSSLKGAAFGTSVNGQCVKVIVGYNFVPISPMMKLFFPSRT